MEIFTGFLFIFGIIAMLFAVPEWGITVAIFGGYALAIYLLGRTVVVGGILASGTALLVIGIIQKVARFIKSHRPYHQV